MAKFRITPQYDGGFLLQEKVLCWWQTVHDMDELPMEFDTEEEARSFVAELEGSKSFAKEAKPIEI